MSVSNKMKTLWRKAAEGRFLLVMLCVSLVLGPRAYAQTQTQPASADSRQMTETPEASEVPPVVAKELQALKANRSHTHRDRKLRPLPGHSAHT